MNPRFLKTFFFTIIGGCVLMIITEYMKTNEKVERSRRIFNLIQSSKTEESKERNHLQAEKEIEEQAERTFESGPSIGSPLRVFSPRVFCGIMASIKYAEEGAYAVNKTWAPRCDYPHFMFSEQNKRNWSLLGAVNLPVREWWSFISEKTQATFRWAYSMYKDKVGWYMKADDDTYVIMENLKYLLYGIDPDKPYYLGWRMMNANKANHYGYHQGGAGYLLSREATRLLVEIGPNLKGCPQKGWAEDANIGICMEALNVSLVQAVDSYNKMIFHMFPVYSRFKSKRANYRNSWCRNEVYNSTDEMPSRHCPLSTRAATFHHLSVQDIYLLEYLIYDLCVNDSKMCRSSTLPGIRQRDQNE